MNKDRALLFLLAFFGAVSFAWSDEANVERIQSKYEQAERQAAKVAEQWRIENARSETNAETLSTLERNLADLVRQAFALRRELQETKIERARTELRDIERKLKNRVKNQSQIVTRRIEELKSGEDLSWLAAGRSSSGIDRAKNVRQRRINRMKSKSTAPRWFQIRFSSRIWNTWNLKFATRRKLTPICRTTSSIDRNRKSTAGN